jgi:L-fucose isomerase-like protein
MSKIEEYKERYIAAMHGIQSGVRLALERGSQEGSPKHLRVGVNAIMVQHAALAKLLISKKIISEEEYWKFQAEQAEEERKSYEKFASEGLGANITFG